MLGMLTKLDPNSYIERYKLNLNLDDNPDELLVKQSRDAIEEFGLFSKKMITILKIWRDLAFKMIPGKTQQSEYYKTLMETMRKFEETWCWPTPDEYTNKFVVGDPCSHRLKRKCDDLADKFNNPYIDLYNWILGEIMDVEALQESIIWRDKIIQAKQKIELRK